MPAHRDTYAEGQGLDPVMITSVRTHVVISREDDHSCIKKLACQEELLFVNVRKNK
jgi:hypothetical protein